MTAESPDTDELIRRAAGNDSQATQQLLTRHRDRLERMVQLRMDPRLRARVDPSDIVQDVMVHAVHRLPHYLAERPIAFYPWLRQLAWEQMVDTFRKHIAAQRRSVDREVDLNRRFDFDLTNQSAMLLANALVARHSTPSQRLGREEMRRHVQNALDRIPAGYRELLLMRYLEELSIKEIADCLGVSEAAVKMRHMRALKQLGTLLSKPGTDRSS